MLSADAVARFSMRAIDIQKEIFASRRFPEGQMLMESAYYGAINMQQVKQNNRCLGALLSIIELVA